MKTKNLIMVSLVLIGAAFITSCKKEKVKGCTTSYATNYNTSAEEDDGSCTYNATVQFWYDQTTSDSLVNNNIVNLTYKIDGSIIGSSASSVYFTGDPSCSQSGPIRLTKSLGTSKVKSASYSVEDQNGNQIWNDNITFDATKSCNSIQLVW